MTLCPECDGEFEAGVKRCPRCDVSLVDAQADVSNGDLVEVWRAQGEMDAQLVRAMLDSSGIDAILTGESVRLTHAFTIDGLAEVRILVREDDAEDACELLVASDVATGCPECGELSPNGSSRCRSCKAHLN